jgi:Flp pilus assembly protein TadB
VTANAPQWNIVIDAVFQFNQAFARIYCVAASAAVLLWSASALKNVSAGDSVPGRGIAIYGCAIAVIVPVLIAVGHLRLNVHGMAVVVAAHSIWFVGTGWQLYRQSEIAA